MENGKQSTKRLISREAASLYRPDRGSGSGSGRVPSLRCALSYRFWCSSSGRFRPLIFSGLRKALRAPLWHSRESRLGHLWRRPFPAGVFHFFLPFRGSPEGMWSCTYRSINSSVVPLHFHVRLESKGSIVFQIVGQKRATEKFGSHAGQPEPDDGVYQNTEKLIGRPAPLHGGV
jgi:hypothetical protein